MDILFQLLLLTHIAALVVGTATAVAMPVIMSRMPAAGPDDKQMLGGIGQRLARNAQISLLVLLASGIAMMFVRYGGFDGMNVWFWVKMAFVAVMLVVLVANLVLKPGTLNPRVMMWVSRLSLIGVITSAVFAFN